MGHPVFDLRLMGCAGRLGYNIAMRRNSERGQALVEFALLLPILAMITVGAVDLGRAYFAYTTVANAAREGAACASVDSLCPAGPQAAALAEVNGSLPGGITTTVTGGATRGSNVTVTVTHSFQAQTALILGQRTFPISASATMVVQ
jgi:Flp pilus assembly protein TadG